MGTTGPNDNPDRNDPLRGVGRPNANPDPLDDVFEEIFGGGQRRRGGAAASVRGDDLRHDVTLTLEEVVLGGEKTIRFPRLETCGDCQGSGAQAGTHVETCTACQGSGQVYTQRNMVIGSFTQAHTCAQCQGAGRIIAHPCSACKGAGRTPCLRERTIQVPVGVETDMRLSLSQEGDMGPLGGPSGDVYVVFQVEEHKLFRREGIDLYYPLPISEQQAAEGAEVLLPLIQGQKALKIPKGTQTGRQFVLNGYGVQDVAGRYKGNLYVNVLVTQDGTSALEKEERKSKGLFDRLFRR